VPLKIHAEMKPQPTLIDRGRGYEKVQWVAWRESRENVKGYGMTEQEAIDNLKYAVQPDWTGELDGEGPPKGLVIGGNFLFTKEEIVSHNKKQFEK
jgi:hypothetical protein